MPDINWIAAIVGGIAGFFVGGLWYSPYLFQPAWQKETGIEDGHAGAIPPAVRFGTGVALSLISAIMLALVLRPHPSLPFAVAASLAIALAWVVPCFGIQYLFEGRSLRLLAINGGYHCAQFAIIGLVLALWP